MLLCLSSNWCPAFITVLPQQQTPLVSVSVFRHLDARFRHNRVRAPEIISPTVNKNTVSLCSVYDDVQRTKAHWIRQAVEKAHTGRPTAAYSIRATGYLITSLPLTAALDGGTLPLLLRTNQPIKQRSFLNPTETNAIKLSVCCTQRASQCSTRNLLLRSFTTVGYTRTSPPVQCCGVQRLSYWLPNDLITFYSSTGGAHPTTPASDKRY